MAALNPKRARFVAEYLVDLNGTQAAIRAGYAKNSANEQAARLLANDSVKQAVAEGQKQKAAKTGRTALDVLQDIQACTRAAKEDGDLKTALRGLELEGKHLGMFTDKVEHSGSVASPLVINLRRGG